MFNNPKLALIIIGNEILSGRTIDSNINYIACNISKVSVELAEVRVVSDNEMQIINAVRELSDKYDYVVTTGGIGPTHDDITASSVAKAFGRKIIRDKRIVNQLAEYYKDKGELTEERLLMSDVPENSGLIDNAESGAPGFFVENVYCLAGVPKIMQSMFDSILKDFKTGSHIYSSECKFKMVESKIAKILEKAQMKFINVEIGSYPQYNTDGPEVSICIRSLDLELNNRVMDEIIKDVLDSNNGIKIEKIS